MNYEEKLDNTLLHLREILLERHDQIGEHDLMEFGEFGMVVRASDEVAKLKTALLTDSCFDECTCETWSKLAEHAVQALVYFAEDETEDILEEIDEEEANNAFCTVEQIYDQLQPMPGIRLSFGGPLTDDLNV